MLESCGFNFFEADSELDGEIYLHGLKAEIGEIISHIGGPSAACCFLNCKYSKLKEWPLGRKPISLLELKKLISSCNRKFSTKMKEKIYEKELLVSTSYSKHKVLFPKRIFPELSYVIGLLLGDGSLAGKSSNKKGNWSIRVFFDNKEHMLIYKNAIQQIFGILPVFEYRDNSYYNCYFASKAVHWFLKTFFGLKTGAKASLIEIPNIILNSSDENIKACIAGLIDSDGTVTVKRKAVKYSSTSKRIVDQVKIELEKREFSPKVYKWLKEPKYKMLYTLILGKRHELLKFAEEINLRHPIKRQKLEKIKLHGIAP